jgi:gas vesicle protein
MDKSRELAAMIVGAIIGGLAGCLFFTERGRSVRRQIEPALEDFSREVINFRNAIQKAAGVANEGWKLLNDALSEDGKTTSQYPTGQRFPF